MDTLIILFRWIHIMSAILAIGGLFFFRVILPVGLAEGPAESREAVYLRCRRLFKKLAHTCIGLLLVSGIFNTWRNWGDYARAPGMAHGIWGVHAGLGLAVMAMTTILLARPTPPKWHKKGAAVNLVLMFVLVAAGSSSKFVRDWALKTQPPPAPPATPALPAGAVR